MPKLTIDGHLQDASTAKALAFNKDVRTRCITLEGDDFNPGGTLTGQLPNPSYPTMDMGSAGLICFVSHTSRRQKI